MAVRNTMMAVAPYRIAVITIHTIVTHGVCHWGKAIASIGPDRGSRGVKLGAGEAPA
jgi:hypothetical protein